jgi:Flp pilus assembly protein TadD
LGHDFQVIGVKADAEVVWDQELTDTWLSMEDAGRTEEAVRMLERVLEDRPDDPDVLMLQAHSLQALGRDGESIKRLQRAVELGQDNPWILTRAASSYYFHADLRHSRTCLDRARQIAPRDFPARRDLKELDRNLRRRERDKETNARLIAAFEADPTDRETAIWLVRARIRTGLTYSGYHIVSRALLHHPDDRTLRRLERKLRRKVPAVERAEAMVWARSGDSVFARSDRERS